MVRREDARAFRARPARCPRGARSLAERGRRLWSCAAGRLTREPRASSRLSLRPRRTPPPGRPARWPGRQACRPRRSGASGRRAESRALVGRALSPPARALVRCGDEKRPLSAPARRLSGRCGRDHSGRALVRRTAAPATAARGPRSTRHRDADLRAVIVTPNQTPKPGKGIRAADAIRAAGQRGCLRGQHNLGHELEIQGTSIFFPESKISK